MAEQDAERIRRAEAVAADRRSKGGFFNKLQASVRPGPAKARSSMTSTLFKRQEKNHATRERKFNTYFRFPSGQERLLWQSKRLRLANGFTSVVGKIFVSENWLCFRESKVSMRRGNRNFVLQLPLSEIVTVQRAQAVKPASATSKLEFLLKHDLGSFADSLLVYSRDRSIHQFWSFWSTENFEDTFNVLDSIWRSRVLGQPRRVPEAAVAPVGLYSPMATSIVPAPATAVTSMAASSIPLPPPPPTPASLLAGTPVGIVKPSSIYERGLAGTPTAAMAPRTVPIINTAHATFVPEGGIMPSTMPTSTFVPEGGILPRAMPMTSTFVPTVAGTSFGGMSKWPSPILNEIRSFGGIRSMRPSTLIEKRYVVVTDDAIPKRTHQHRHRRHHHAHRKERPGVMQTFDQSRSTGGFQSKLPSSLLQNIRGFNKQGLRHVLPRVSYQPVSFEAKQSRSIVSQKQSLVPESPGAQQWMAKRDSVVRAVRQEKPHLRHVQALEKHGLSMSEEYTLSMPSSSQQSWRQRTLPDSLARDIIMFNSTGLQRLRHIGGPMERPFFDQIPSMAEYRKKSLPSQMLGQLRGFPRQSLRHVQVPDRTSILRSMYLSRHTSGVSAPAPSSQWTLKQPGGLGEITLKGWLLWPSSLRTQLRSFDHTRLRRVGPRMRPTWDVIPEDIERTKPFGRSLQSAAGSSNISGYAPKSSTIITSVYSGATTAKATFVPAPSASMQKTAFSSVISGSPRTSRLSATRSSPLAPRRGL